MRASVSVRTGGCFLEPGIAGDRIKYPTALKTWGSSLETNRFQPEMRRISLNPISHRFYKPLIMLFSQYLPAF